MTQFESLSTVHVSIVFVDDLKYFGFKMRLVGMPFITLSRFTTQSNSGFQHWSNSKVSNTTYASNFKGIKFSHIYNMKVLDLFIWFPSKHHLKANNESRSMYRRIWVYVCALFITYVPKAINHKCKIFFAKIYLIF